MCTVFIFTAVQEIGTTPVFNYKIRNQGREWLDGALHYGQGAYPYWACLFVYLTQARVFHEKKSTDKYLHWHCSEGPSLD